MANEAEPVFAHFTTLSAWLFVFRLFVTHVLSIAAAQVGQCLRHHRHNSGRFSVELAA